MTVGVLITAISLALLMAAMRRTNAIEVTILAIAAAAGLIGIDVIYVARGVLYPVDLGDAAIRPS
jgi:hypothetical protein